MENQKPEAEYNLFDWYKKVLFENYANFEGRARRAEYWWFVLANLIVTFSLLIICMVLIFGIAALSAGTETDALAGLIIVPIGFYFVYALLTIIPRLAVGVRRLHDTGKSGWLMLLSLVPFGSIILLIWHIEEGQRGPNEYGEDPKGFPPSLPNF